MGGQNHEQTEAIRRKTEVTGGLSPQRKVTISRKVIPRALLRHLRELKQGMIPPRRTDLPATNEARQSAVDRYFL